MTRTCLTVGRQAAHRNEAEARTIIAHHVIPVSGNALAGRGNCHTQHHKGRTALRHIARRRTATIMGEGKSNIILVSLPLRSQIHRQLQITHQHVLQVCRLIIRTLRQGILSPTWTRRTKTATNRKRLDAHTIKEKDDAEDEDVLAHDVDYAIDETADLFNDNVLSYMTKTPPQPDEATHQEHLTYVCDQMLRDAPTGATRTPQVDSEHCPTCQCAGLQSTPSAAKLIGKELLRY